MNNTENMAGNEYVLAVYDIQSKQEFIYKSNKMRQISGASLIIRDCFKENLLSLESIDEKTGGNKKDIFDYRNVKLQQGGIAACEKVQLVDEESEKDKFMECGFKSHIAGGYWGELIYEGGGNCYVLYKDLDAYKQINKRFYKKLLEETYSLQVLTSYIVGVHFDNFKEDWDRLEEKHRVRKAQNVQMHPVNALPIVQVDERNYMPLAEKVWIGTKKNEKNKEKPLKVSYESYKKYKKFYSFMGVNETDNANNAGDPLYEFVSGERFLDDIVTERGEESLLAVVYIDGNNMGARLKACIKEEPYEKNVDRLRAFSKEIQTLYIDNRLEKINKLLDQKEEYKRRFVIYAGDEITFICNARHAYDVACEYLETLYEELEEDRRTSCAGICIFHSHMPFADAYKIAEECCASAKKKMQQEDIKKASLLDFHYCQGAIGTSLEDIREHEGSLDISRPWFIVYDNNRDDNYDENKVENKIYITKTIVDEMKNELKKLERSNIKDLMFAAKKSQADFAVELARIKAHKEGKQEGKPDFTLKGKLDEETQRKLIYDMAMVYDLWFPHMEIKEGETNE